MQKGQFVEIVEQIDCTEQQREIREVFPSYYCVRTEELLFALSKLTNHNKKGEYYLTDIYAILRKAGKKVIAVQAVTAEDVIAPNTRQQLAEADAAMQERIQRAHSRKRRDDRQRHQYVCRGGRDDRARISVIRAVHVHRARQHDWRRLRDRPVREFAARAASCRRERRVTGEHY